MIWKSTSLKNVVVNSIAVSVSDPELIYAGCGGHDYSSSGIYKSTDGGRTWKQKICGLPASTGILKSKKQPYFAVTDIRIDSKSDDIVYAALSDQGIYTSLDAGNYWTRIGLSDYLIYTVNTRYSTPNSSSSKKLQTSLSTLSSDVIAGTASGIYHYKTTGTGVLTGTISSAETGELIDSATLSTTYGSSCLSSNGYYLLLLPAGNHSVTAQATAYIPATVSDITVHAGQSSTCNITLLPQTDNGTCLASLILDRTPLQKEIPLLRQFRDRVLMKTTLGKHLTSLYYTLGRDVWHVLQKHPGLKKRCLKLMLKSIPIIKAALTEKNPPVTSALLCELRPLLFDLEMASPPRLKKQINRLRMQMRSFKVEELF